MLGDGLLQPGQARRVTVQQVELVLLGTDRALEPSERIPLDERLQTFVPGEQLLGGRGEPLAQRGDLCRDVVAPADQLGVGELGRP